MLKGRLGAVAQGLRRIGRMIQCACILGRLQQMLAVVYMRQVRGACLPVINGTEVGSSGGIIMMQASTSDVVGVFTVVRVCHL